MNDNSLLKTLIEKYSLNNTVESLALFKKLGITSVFDISGLTEADFKDRVSNAIKKPDDAPEVALRRIFPKSDSGSSTTMPNAWPPRSANSIGRNRVQAARFRIIGISMAFGV